MSERPHLDPSITKLPKRAREAHKGHFGRVLVVGGSVGMVGAPALAANAALRGGAGLVKIACPDRSQQATAGLAPCATSEPLPSTGNGLISAAGVEQLETLAAEHDVLAIGPGMGVGSDLVEVLTGLLALPEKPKVIDADGLNNLANVNGWWQRARGPIVLTPHPGEMRRLIDGARLDCDLADRRGSATALSRTVGAIVVLKGAGTVVADGDRVFVNRTGNPGMATAGAGDVLTGLIAALIGQGMTPFDAAVLGVHIHGLAGDLASEELGQVSLVATDLIEFLPEAFALV
ncbi:MAG: NAD(P)H-hydrate dehydratase [Phycisphaerae bacterium]|nr:NAD(P)H-hydrate dehydratase [Phycisphaerae bacterium]